MFIEVFVVFCMVEVDFDLFNGFVGVEWYFNVVCDVGEVVLFMFDGNDFVFVFEDEVVCIVVVCDWLCWLGYLLFDVLVEICGFWVDDVKEVLW